MNKNFKLFLYQPLNAAVTKFGLLFEAMPLLQ